MQPTFFCSCSLCVRTFLSESVLFCFVRGPFSVTNGVFKRTDVFHHNIWTYSWRMQIDQIHWDSSFIMTPSGPFLVTRTSRADNSLRLKSCRPFTPQADFYSASLADRFYHTRTSARRTREPSSFARTTPSRIRTIFILEDPDGYFRVIFA